MHFIKAEPVFRIRIHHDMDPASKNQPKSDVSRSSNF